MSTPHKVETIIRLNKFVPRPYQLPILDAVENKGYRRLLAILPRRAGKDITAFNLAIRFALKKVCVIYYIFPTYSQGKKVIFDSITNDGQRILDYIPKELIESINTQEMKIRFKNGSLIQVVGSDNYDSLMGTNPQLCIFSEYALQDPMAWNYIRPILAANDGVAIFLSTPRGFNHMFAMYEMAKQNPQWFVLFMTVDDTQHLSEEALEEERKDMPEDLYQQEFYCSFSLGIEGSVYAKTINNLRLKGQIGPVPWESAFKVHTAWDIGRDATCIIFFQSIGQTVRVIDYIEKSNENLEYFVKRLAEKPYIYGKHFFPHDMRVTEWGGLKFTRVEKARQLGIKATLVDDVSLEDGIEYVQTSLPKMWIDDKTCALLIKALENYRYEWNDKTRVYKRVPLHNWASHGADAMRYLCLSLPKTKDGLSAEDLDKRYREAVGGYNDRMPAVFRTDLPDY